MIARLKRISIDFRYWLKRHRQRYLYQAEIAHLRRELVVLYQKDQALETMFILKQEKINRLLPLVCNVKPTALRNSGVRTEDLRPEKIIKSYDQMISDCSSDFEDRQAQYEKSREYDHQESALTRTPFVTPKAVKKSAQRRGTKS